ncbi:hypothetical protein PLEOSDRAFT_152889 [Pleurotus ostreatus PC15]|uniref:Uncharacterized protein n=1 Tax=Pleurotus ostreatus (strain PC15) TaxID=1137138 RepID=A0A067NZY7_PLEO1|nr:hypothetical protein PLEOSDRAFT_152889 [Pleurotus ostreatus PC15]
MLTYRGFSAWIACEGQPLPEYLVAVEEDVRQVSCWIPSEEGKSFAVFWRDNTDPAPAPAPPAQSTQPAQPEQPAHPIDSCGFITLDGLVVPGRFLFGSGTASRAGVRSGPNTEKPFVFLRVGEEEGDGGGGVDASSSLKPKKDLGTIILRIRRVLRVEGCPANPIKAVPSKVLGKRKTGDVGIGFGDDVPAYYQSPATWEVQPYPEDAHLGAASYVTFVFRYRSAEFLESQGIMPSPRAQPQPLANASAAGSSHYRTRSSSAKSSSTAKAKGKGKGKAEGGDRGGGTGLETPAMTPLPIPVRSLPPPTAQQEASGALPVYPPVYPPLSEVQFQQLAQQQGGTLVEASAGSAEASASTMPVPGPPMTPMTPTPSATPANADATPANAMTGDTTTLGNGNGNGGGAPAVNAMRRIVSAPIVPTRQQLQLQEQRLQGQSEGEREREGEHEHERESEVQQGRQRQEESSSGAAGVSVSPPRKRLKQSDFLANGPYRMRRPSDMKRSMSWRAPNSKPSSSSTTTSTSATSIPSTSNAASAITTASSSNDNASGSVNIAFNNPFTIAPLTRSISNPHPHPQLNPRARLNPQGQPQSRSHTNEHADAVGLGPTQLPPHSQPPNNHSQPHTQQPQSPAQAPHYRSQQQTLALARAQCRHLPYRRPSINTTRALQQKRQQRQMQMQMQASARPPPPSSSSPFSSSPETPVAEEFGRVGEASVDASPVLGGGGGSGSGIGSGIGVGGVESGDGVEGGDGGGDGGVEAKRRGSRRIVYEDLGGIGPRDFGLDDVGGESDGGGEGSASSSQESALGLGLGMGMGNGLGLSSFEGDQFGGYDFAGFGGFGGFGGGGGDGEDIGGGAGGEGGMGTGLGLEGADPYVGFFQSGY